MHNIKSLEKNLHIWLFDRFMSSGDRISARKMHVNLQYHSIILTFVSFFSHWWCPEAILEWIRQFTMKKLRVIFNDPQFSRWRFLWRNNVQLFCSSYDIFAPHTFCRRRQIGITIIMRNHPSFHKSPIHSGTMDFAFLTIFIVKRNNKRQFIPPYATLCPRWQFNVQ